ncbi:MULTISPECIES: YoaK family protein [Sphingobacterium]|uniref:YoaK family protein n=1 Tax=Sphingobacterium TaxID=28453 RepID=UPI00257948DD|nr:MULTISPECIES: YoaK family protein [Sphingobacterium]
MENLKNTHITTLVLTLVGGYCDTVTFVAADKIFSAHVTGNFIVFAYQLINGGDIMAWIKLATFPVFVASVMVGGWLSSRSHKKNTVLFVEALLLVIAGLLAYILPVAESKTVMYGLVLLIVFALGMQNAFGKLFVKATHGPTTMMTGNVTQASLDLCVLIANKFKNPETNINFGKQLITLFGFFIGCLAGAYFGKQLGLTSIIFAGVAMLICYALSKDKDE